MKSEKVDRRVKYTRMVLKESLIKLLEKKDLSQITIKEICEEADVNRATFYAHYSDQHDLLLKIEDELLSNVRSYLSDYIKGDTGLDMVSAVELVFDYIRENAKLCKLLLSERGDLSFQKKIMMFVYERNIGDLIRSGSITREEAEYIYAFSITGCVGAAQKWLEGGMKQSSRFMAELLVRLSQDLPASFK